MSSAIGMKCNEGYAATFNWEGKGKVTYSTPGFHGSFATTVEHYSGEGENDSK